MKHLSIKWCVITGLLVIIIIAGVSLSSGDKTPKLNLDPTLRERYRSPLLFEMLGYIDDNDSRHIYVGHNETVDRFYISDKSAADQFEVVLNRFIEQNNLQTKLVREDQEHFIYFSSEEITDIINSCYSPQTPPVIIGSCLDDSITSASVMYECLIDMTFFKSATEEEMMAFIRGAYSRYGEKNAFINPSRQYLIILYLAALECEVKTMSLASYIPSTNIIVFDPSEKVQRNLNITSFYNIILQEGNPEEPSLPNFTDTDI